MILLDYELAIEQAASEAGPNILIQKRTERNKDKKTMIRISRTSRRPPMKQNGLLGSKDGGEAEWVGECRAKAVASRSFDNANSMTY